MPFGLCDMCLKIRIGTRKSPLAMAQSRLVGDEIKVKFPGTEIEYVSMNTLGDKRLDIALQEIGGKGVFTRELEEAILHGEIDLAVHSAKDLPLSFDKNLKICPVLKRGCAGDVLILRKGNKLEDNAENIIKDFARGFKIGTSSKRRAGQILLLNEDVNIVPIRGNISTRISKITKSEVDAIVLAGAGLNRLADDREFLEVLNCLDVYNIPENVILPAPAQGILCAEYADEKTGKILEKLQDSDCKTAFFAERYFLELLQADCHTSAGISLKFDNSEYLIKAYFEGKYAFINCPKNDETQLFNALERLVRELK